MQNTAVTFDAALSLFLTADAHNESLITQWKIEVAKQFEALIWTEKPPLLYLPIDVKKQILSIGGLMWLEEEDKVIPCSDELFATITPPTQDIEQIKAYYTLVNLFSFSIPILKQIAKHQHEIHYLLEHQCHSLNEVLITEGAPLKDNFIPGEVPALWGFVNRGYIQLLTYLLKAHKITSQLLEQAPNFVGGNLLHLLTMPKKNTTELTQQYNVCIKEMMKQNLLNEVLLTTQLKEEPYKGRTFIEVLIIHENKMLNELDKARPFTAVTLAPIMKNPDTDIIKIWMIKWLITHHKITLIRDLLKEDRISLALLMNTLKTSRSLKTTLLKFFSLHYNHDQELLTSILKQIDDKEQLALLTEIKSIGFFKRPRDEAEQAIQENTATSKPRLF